MSHRSCSSRRPRSSFVGDAGFAVGERWRAPRTRLGISLDAHRCCPIPRRGCGRAWGRSSRPRSSRRRTRPRSRAAIVAARVRHRSGQDWIGSELEVSVRTVSWPLRRRRVPDVRVLDPLTGGVINSPKTTAAHDERDQPGEMIQVDVTKIGRMPDGEGGAPVAALLRLSQLRKTTGPTELVDVGSPCARSVTEASTVGGWAHRSSTSGPDLGTHQTQGSGLGRSDSSDRPDRFDRVRAESTPDRSRHWWWSLRH